MSKGPMNESTYETERICNLTSQQILSILADRTGRERAKEVLQKAARMFIVLAKAQPAHASGILAAAHLLGLYEEYLDPTGKLLTIPADAVAKRVLSHLPQVKVTVAEPLEVAVKVSTPKIEPEQQAEKDSLPAELQIVPKRQSTVRGPKRLEPTSKLGKIMLRMLEMEHNFRRADVKLLPSEYIQDLSNALFKGKNFGWIESPALGLYRVTESGRNYRAQLQDAGV